MDWGQIKTNVANLGIVALLSFAVGVLFANGETAGMNNEVADLKRTVGDDGKRLGAIETRDKTEREFLNCVQLALQSLRQGARTEQVCQLRAE